MKRIKVGIGGNGTVRIKLKKARKDERVGTAEMRGSHAMHPASPAPATAAGSRGLTLSHPILSQMEIRVESVFRPKEPDVEVVYALTGYGTSVDHLHKFSSNEVVAHATPEMISYVAEKMVEHIRAERAEMFGVHAVGGEERRPRSTPERVSENRLRWSSITRTHEVAFFDEHAEPVTVRID